MPAYILGTKEVRALVAVFLRTGERETNTIKKENIIKDYTNSSNHLKVIAKGNKNPLATL